MYHTSLQNRASLVRTSSRLEGEAPWVKEEAGRKANPARLYFQVYLSVETVLPLLIGGYQS